MSLCIIMNILKNRSIIAIAVAFAAVTITSCNSDKKEKEEIAQTVKQRDAVETPAVEVIPAQKGKISSTIAVPGELIPYQEVDLYAKVTSYVKTLKVDIGSEVHAGELLATLEAPEINSQ